MVGTTPMMVAAKVVVDQAITAPPILATFYTGMRSKKLSMLRLLLHRNIHNVLTYFTFDQA